MTVPMNDMILVSVDDHMVEPPDMYDRHIPAKYRDRAPRIVERGGTQVWEFEGKISPNIGLAATVGRKREELGLEPNRFDQMRSGCYDVHDRIMDMNANGTFASLCFPTAPGIPGTQFSEIEDRQLGLAVLRAYNDWHMADWVGPYPTRFIPLAQIPYWDPKLAAEEVRRMADMGCKTFNFCQNVTGLGLPSIHDEFWDPFFDAVCDVDGAITVHLGTGFRQIYSSLDAPYSGFMAMVNMDMANFTTDIIFSPRLQRYPNLRIALSEGGIGWIPFFLERCKWIHERHSVWANDDLGGHTVEEIFRRHFLTCFIDDPVGIEMRHRIGIDTISWECDYPHSDCTWPESPEFLATQFEGISAEDISKITYENAIRFFRFDGLEKAGRENATVGALRAKAQGLDLSAPSAEGMTAAKAQNRQLKVGDLMHMIV